MNFFKSFSFHPRLAAIFDGIFSLILIWWVGHITALWLFIVWFVFRLLWWAALTNVMYFPPFISRLRHYLSLILFQIGFVFLVLFNDLPQTGYLLSLIFLTGPFISFFIVPPKADGLTVMAKPHRRLNLLLSVIGIAGIWCGALALAQFQITSGWTAVVSFLIATFITALVSWFWWREYGLEKTRTLYLSLSVLSLAILELAYIVWLWPLGYFIMSFLLTWLWYMLWLLLRFYQTAEGIDWGKQRWFLAFNFLLILALLIFIVRWK